MRKLTLTYLFIALFLNIGFTQSCNSKMKFEIQSKSGTHTPDEVSVQALFRNDCTDTIRLLNQFDPAPVFFSIQISKEDGSVIPLPGAGKIAFDNSTLTYIKIPPGEVFVRELDLSELLKQHEQKFEKGKYSVKIDYHNQYGENCVQGWYNSNQIEIKVE